MKFEIEHNQHSIFDCEIWGKMGYIRSRKVLLSVRGGIRARQEQMFFTGHSAMQGSGIFR